jgi:hypothetical protein
MQLTAEWTCGYCGETVDTSVDASAGESQSYIEDCAVCCRPNVLYVTIDLDAHEATITAEFEG